MNQSSRLQTSEKIHIDKEGFIFHFYGPVTVVLSNSGQPRKNLTDSRLLTNYERRLQKLLEQQALLGIKTPPEVSLEIEDLREKITELRME